MTENPRPDGQEPTDVDYDESAVEEAAERMHSTGKDTGRDDDPTGDHDEGAAREAAKRMGTEGD